MKVYDIYLTPYEKLTSLQNFERYLKEDVSKESLEKISRKKSDNECGKKMQEAGQKDQNIEKFVFVVLLNHYGRATPMNLDVSFPSSHFQVQI